MHMNHPDLYGSAVWADPSDIADRFAYVEGECVWLGRNPYNFKDMIGVKDDRHVFICAETRSGKGRALLVNNQVLWPGSMITVTPKGEETSIAAPRRGHGNEYCEGMGQDVYVLDPMRCADVPDEYRAHFNMLAALDPEDDELVAKVDHIPTPCAPYRKLLKPPNGTRKAGHLWPTLFCMSSPSHTLKNTSDIS